MFLDEIGDMNLVHAGQAAARVAGAHGQPGRRASLSRSTCGCISATHRDLADAVAIAAASARTCSTGWAWFRSHCRRCASGSPTSLPLAEHFLALAGAPHRLAADAAGALLAHAWPGNVRELRNVMERVAAMVRQPVVTAADLAFLRPVPARDAGTDWLAGELPEALARLEAEMIRRALAASGGNRAEAARRLGIHRQLLYEKLRRQGQDSEG